jgi:sigma-B regulation protein RsbU (phosphoserine phosphatase)
MSEELPQERAAVGGQDPLARLRHDLSTPINQILGYSELLEEEASAGQDGLVADLRKIQQAARTLQAMVRGGLAPAVSAGPARASHVDEPTERDQHVEAAHGPIRPGRILLVDDDPLNLDLLAQRLTPQGHIVSCAADGQDALAQLRHQPFDLVLLDVIMPRLDGYATLAALKADEELRSIPVIMISALDELSSVVRCIEAGAEDYLPKPFNPTLLRARVGASLEKKFAYEKQIALYQQLLSSQRQLDRELAEAHRRVAQMAPEVRQDPGVAPLLEAFARMSGAVSRRETDLRSTISELKIEINRQQLGSQLRAIVADPGFANLSERVKAMRERRRREPSDP